MRHLLLSLFVLLATSFRTQAQITDVECPDDTLTTYLLALLDTLYSNGLTHYETLLATISESDSGYELLESWYSDDDLTLFVPTDAAFQNAGLVPPFTALGVEELTNLVAFHAANGYHGYSSLPQSPNKDIAPSLLSIPHYLNSTVGSTAYAPLVLQQGSNQAISIRLASGNATTWGWEIAGTGENNIVIIPVDTVLPFPPKLSEALTMSTTSRSKSGLLEFQSALNSVGGAQQLEAPTPSGFTIFAPVDDAFCSDIQSALGNSNVAVQVLGNHVSCPKEGLFSGFWVNDGTFELPVSSGETLVVNSQSGGATITLGNVTVTILRSDITLENGVMHIVDGVLADSGSLAATGTSTGIGSSSSKSTSATSSTGTQNGTSALSSGAGRTAGAAAALLFCSFLVGLLLIV